jgi:hypothetical protein
VFLSLGYTVVRWVLQLATLRLRSNECKDLEIVVLRHEFAILRPSGDDVDRSVPPRGRQSAPAAPPLAVLHHHARDPPALASALGGEAVDVSASSRASANSP